MPADKPTELSRIKLKTWTRQPVPTISEHSAHSTSLPVGFCTWLWRYTCLLLLIWYPQLFVLNLSQFLSFWWAKDSLPWMSRITNNLLDGLPDDPCIYLDDVVETFSALLAICAGIHRSPALMFSLIWAWMNAWVNNREAGDLRRHRVNYDGTVIIEIEFIGWIDN